MRKLICLKEFFFLILGTLAVGCATTGDVVLRTEPADAKVYVVDVMTGQAAFLGNSPLSFSKQIPEAKNSDVIQLKIEKDGFVSRYTSVASFGGETTYLDLKLNSVLETNGDLQKAFERNRQLFSEANRLALGKRFSEALVRIQQIIDSDPKNDEGHAAKGSLLYLMKDYDGALQAWTKSLELNPGNDSVRAAILDLNLSLQKQSRYPATSEEK